MVLGCVGVEGDIAWIPACGMEEVISDQKIGQEECGPEVLAGSYHLVEGAVKKDADSQDDPMEAIVENAGVKELF